MTPHTLWSPTRQTIPTRVFMSTLHLHSPAWSWVDTPETAPWWVIDATRVTDIQSLVQQYEQLRHKPKVAFLALHIGQLPHADWQFFKPPLESGKVFNWIGHTPRQAERPMAVSARPATSATTSAPWRQGLLRLTRWPNVARYHTAAGALELTGACSRLLATPATYAQVLEWGAPAELLDRMLQDALENGLLTISVVESAAARQSSGRATPAVAPADASRWDLVKRLLVKKFSFRTPSAMPAPGFGFRVSQHSA
jgi:hypothetical protein